MACKQCSYFSEFTEPRDLAVAGEKYKGAFCYGVCYQQKLAAGNFQGYPIYVPEGTCKEFRRKRGLRKTDVLIDGQIKLPL